MGERTPMWDPDARGVLLGLTLAHTRSDIIRALLEGVAYALNSILDVMQELEIDVKDMRIIGGGAKSHLWLEIMASVYQRPLRVPTHVREATSLGAALAAGVGVGIFADYPQAAARVTVAKEQDPNPDWTTRYVALRSYYESLYPALRDSFKQLAQLDVPCSPFQGG
jgi:xylulokinase